MEVHGGTATELAIMQTSMGGMVGMEQHTNG
jgi:hypothetical protein